MYLMKPRPRLEAKTKDIVAQQIVCIKKKKKIAEAILKNFYIFLLISFRGYPNKGS